MWGGLRKTATTTKRSRQMASSLRDVGSLFSQSSAVIFFFLGRKKLELSPRFMLATESSRFHEEIPQLRTFHWANKALSGEREDVLWWELLLRECKVVSPAPGVMFVSMDHTVMAVMTVWVSYAPPWAVGTSGPELLPRTMPVVRPQQEAWLTSMALAATKWQIDAWGLGCSDHIDVQGPCCWPWCYSGQGCCPGPCLGQWPYHSQSLNWCP